MGPKKAFSSSSSSATSKPKLASKRSNRKSLKSGRPPLLSSSPSSSTKVNNGGGPSITAPSLSSRHTRKLIRTHHTLQKRLSRARAENDTALVEELESQLSASGGLATYQHASTVGQSAERGGDSSRVLVRWLKDELDFCRQAATVTTVAAAEQRRQQHQPRQMMKRLRILEVGALSTTNALNVPHATTVRRIDLRSSGPGIEEADFMQFPLPDGASGKGVWQGERGYDVLSLSLVLNYVPDARGRGDMLRRTTRFFFTRSDSDSDSDRAGGDTDMDVDESARDRDGGHGRDIIQSQTSSSSSSSSRRPPKLPCLFLVLPAPTIHNSRYLTPSHLDLIMSSLGYTRLETKTTRKLHYSLWRYDRDRRDRWIQDGGPTVFAKKEINPGPGRNNFCIVVD
ncbi:hypothetical protein PV08_03823 [Exophiala spinifera]|uniref:25S rRNA adenine-N(1) methyltransferase n=1 Tax=Exophiala spinifera TaxID=91928 RepID=A0A0D2BDE7_9EURO|nr:uncharacterized protein PV08_03823 [Exophiala spinifera]KIW16635.1 hypothetical protein PV08_03823 [Exophiala spinifera]